MPVDKGDSYFSAGYSRYFFNTASFQVARRYLDDDFSSTRQISTKHDRGFLLSFDTSDSWVRVPEINFGWAFEETPFNGALGSVARVHFSVSGHHRTGDGFIAYAKPPEAFEVLTDPITGLSSWRDIAIRWQPLDGSSTLANGDNAIWSHAVFALANNRMAFDDWFGSGDLMIYFDEPKGSWRFSRGVGLTLGWEESQWDWTVSSPEMVAAVSFPGAFAPGVWTYDFQLSTFYFGPRAAFSIGWEPFRQLSFFLSGSLAPMLAASMVEGRLSGPCLAACDTSGLPTQTPGVSGLDVTDINFAYDSRLEAGVSVFLWYVRLTGQIGAFVNNQFAMPREGDGSRYGASLANQWGYYGRATATVSF